MIKAIFFDIDGALVSFNTHKVAQSSIDALHELRKKGIKVFIATGRHPMSINNLGELEFDGFVTINGGYCLVDNNAIFKRTIDKKNIEALIYYLENKEEFPVIFVHENELFINRFNDSVYEILSMLNFPVPPVKPLRHALNSDVFQVISFFDIEQEKRVMKYLEGCDTTRWCPQFTDLIPQGSDKCIGIDEMISHFGFNLDEVMAFGDGGNDIGMLKYVGLGVAMGNATDEVKCSANYITTSVDDDGVYNALVHFGVI